MITRVYSLAVVLILAVALPGLANDLFTGSWEARIGLAPQQTQPFTVFESTLDVGLSVGFLTMNSVSDFVIDGWIWEELGLTASVGFLSADGHMLFDPQSGDMLYAEGVLGVCAGPLTVTLYGALVDATQTASFNYGYVLQVRGDVYGVFAFESATYLGADLSGITFTATGTASDSSLLAKTYLTDPTIDPVTAVFSGQDVVFSASLFGCVELMSLTSFSPDGFEREQITAEFHNVFGIPLILALDLIFEVQTKSYAFTPSFETDFGCLHLFSTIVTVDDVITGLDLYGIKFMATLGAASFESITNLDTANYVITTPGFGSIVEPLADAIAEGHLYYEEDYWEIVTLTVGIPPLGSGFSFSVRTYFSTTDGLLFDWAQSTMGLTLALGASVSTSTAVTVDATGFTGWTLAFRVSW